MLMFMRECEAQSSRRTRVEGCKNHLSGSPIFLVRITVIFVVPNRFHAVWVCLDLGNKGPSRGHGPGKEKSWRVRVISQ